MAYTLILVLNKLPRTKSPRSSPFRLKSVFPLRFIRGLKVHGFREVVNKSSQDKAYLAYKKYFYLVWGGVIGYKLWDEWYLHWANIDLSQLFLGFTGGQ